jgi:hypothetical protein
MSNDCHRFEAEGIQLHEHEVAFEQHVEQCDECQAAGRGYARVRQALARLPAEGGPPPGWEARVFARIRRNQTHRWGWLWRPAAAASVVASASLLVMLWPDRGLPGLEVEVREGVGQTVRTLSAKPGDVLRVRASTAGHRHAELRVYRDGVLELRCTEKSPCLRERGRLSAEVPLSAVGRYESVLVLSDKALSQPPAEQLRRMSPDLDAAISAGAKIVTTGAVDVY